MSHRDDRDPRPADLLAAYEMGLLDEAERVRFERAALEDPALLEDLFDHAQAAQALREDPDRYAAVLRAARREAEPSPAARLVARLRALLSPRVLAPAVVAAAAVLALLVLPGDDDLRKLAVLEPAPYVQVDVRGAEGDAATLFHEAMSHYTARRWDAAAAGLESALSAPDAADWPTAGQARLFLGVSRVLNDEADLALGPLARAARSSQLPVAERARWHLAQAHLALGDAAAAREQLEILRDSPVFGVDAAAQIEEIDALVD